MHGIGRYGKVGDISLNSMQESYRSPTTGGITQITYEFSLDDRDKEHTLDGDSLAGLSFYTANYPDGVVDHGNPTEQTLGGITKVSLSKDSAHNHYVATFTLNQNSLTSSVGNLPIPTSDTPTTYSVASGTSGNDNLIGTAGNDVLLGGDGNDTLKAYGGSKKEMDILTGGNGADTFVLGDRPHGQSDFGDSYQGTGHAIITDFVVGEDKIQLLGGKEIGNYQLKYEDEHIGSSFIPETTIYYKGDIIAYVQDQSVDLKTLSANLRDNPAFTFV